MLRRPLLRTALLSGLVLAAAPAARAQDAADLVVRMNRIENQARQMSGQIETLQYENRQLKEQLRKFQEDVEYRFQESKGGARPAGGAAPAAATPPKPQKRGDAFDPTLNPGAPGAPQTLGAPAAPRPAPARVPPPVAAPRPSQSIAATGTGDAKADYESAYAYVLQRQYEQAEMSLRQFIQSHPRDALVPDATYWLGESYLQRNRTREAAEQFLKVSTDFARSRKAPDAMLKLGTSLNALGAREQACATLAELERKFPQASASVKQGVDREQRRARCAA
ncbi:tol-pal system protein YbgF [Methylobacterium oryzihabitans]|uniref:Cell division coordinator CpoB n=1 Tax=Methylobacterium oryzihabitans TaxID=2499852 RepID=A0A3S2VA70_9HYPH|nr:tol-pal system protein YbgF [Methylobacterium oryzihabitans]RVU18172.1 tol-pal system protein YbgF [Methylobacterium oryzihabitans]